MSVVNVACNLCGSATSTPVLERHGLSVVRCAKCGLVFVNPRPPPEQIRALYEAEEYFRKDPHTVGYRDYFEDAPLHLRTFEREFCFLARVRPGQGALLDVGCAGGFSLKVARDRGWDVQGVEISRFAAEYARNTMGLSVFHGTLADARFADSSFDVVMAYSTLEHSQAPLAFLAEAARILKQDGTLILSVPDMGSWLGSRRFQYKPREHLYYFDRLTLGAMLARAGLKATDWRRMFVSRSARFLCERAGYYFPRVSALARLSESVVKHLRFLDLPLLMPDGHVVVYASKAEE